ncbi:MAG: branched-chain amino acid transaminase [Nanoarchaeota archaeon]|nr:branched-chain amino acid transaminase [Nanoarchaeota archaeon]
METTDKIWMDGELVNWQDAKIHVISHALHYGSSVFEGIRCYKTEKGTAIFRLKEHVERLFLSAETLAMKVPFSKEQIEQAIIETVKTNKLETGYIRPLIFYGYGKMGLDPVGAPVNVTIAVWPWGSYLGDEAVKLKTAETIRLHPKSFKPQAKVGGFYVNSIYAHQEAKKAGFNEALMLDHEGNIAEGPGENIFMMKDGKIITAKAGSILPGITRDTILTIAKDNNIEIEERTVTPEELKQADEVFMVGTAAEVTLVDQIDDTEIKNNHTEEKAKFFRTTYLDIVQGKQDKYKDWLTF